MVSYIEICEKIRQYREAASANVLSQRLTWNVLEIKKMSGVVAWGEEKGGY